MKKDREIYSGEKIDLSIRHFCNRIEIHCDSDNISIGDLETLLEDLKEIIVIIDKVKMEWEEMYKAV